MRKTVYLLALAGIASLAAGCDKPGVTVKAQVYRVARTCGFTTRGPNGASSASRESCSATDEFEKMRRTASKRTRNIDGEAVVKVTYPSPIDQSELLGELHFTGRDDEFYSIEVNDTIEIHVDKKDPSQIWI